LPNQVTVVTKTGEKSVVVSDHFGRQVFLEVNEEEKKYNKISVATHHSLITSQVFSGDVTF
jgi:hypothetical protein